MSDDARKLAEMRETTARDRTGGKEGRSSCGALEVEWLLADRDRLANVAAAAQALIAELDRLGAMRDALHDPLREALSSLTKPDGEA